MKNKPTNLEAIASVALFAALVFMSFGAVILILKGLYWIVQHFGL